MSEPRYPKSDESTLFIQGRDHKLGDLIEQAKAHFGIDDVSDLTFDVDEIQIKCFGYDLYDSADYLFYTVISK